MKTMIAVALTLLLPLPLVQAADVRIVTETYDSSRVYNVYAQIGRATLIQLEAGESLTQSGATALGIGDAAAWELGVRGNNIVLKPKTKLPQTNLIIVTNKRTYSFELRMDAQVVTPTYILRFKYPDTEAAKLAAQVSRDTVVATARAENVDINTNYVWRGDAEALKPTAAWDDGRFTRLVYDHAGALPVFYKVMPDGSEALINWNIDTEERETVVLHEVIGTVRARMGPSVIEIVNRSYKLPAFNRTGTGRPGTVRVDKEAVK
jgi:type IV secretion system protein VirB9